MKILMVNKFLYPAGGAETYMFGLGKQLAALGHSVEYFGMEHPDRCVGNSIDSYTDEVNFRNAGISAKLKYSIKSVYSKEACEKIGKVIENFKPDIVHLNNINFQLTPSIIYEIKRHNIPIVQTVHDTQIACPNHRMYNEKKGEICSKCFGGNYLYCIKDKCVHDSLLKSVVAAYESYYYHKRNTYSLIDCYVCPSNFIASVVKGQGIDSKKIEILHNYCNTPKENLAHESKRGDYVLYFGRISVEKGIKTLIDVCKQLPEIKFIFAGTGPLLPMCDGVKNIEAVGFKSGEELNSLIKNAAFSVCPSECNENCPMSILESLALGTPVICSDLGGAPELVIPGKTGEIFKAYDKNELKEKISELYNSPDLLEEMSRQCIQSSTNTLQKYTDNLIDIYNRIIGSKG